VVSGQRLTMSSLGGLFPGVVFYLSMVRVEHFAVKRNLADVQLQSGTNVLNANIASPSSSQPRLWLVHSVASWHGALVT
jgi:hypothetical protein